MTAFASLHVQPSQTLRQALEPLMRTQTLGSGEVLYRYGTKPRGVYIIEKGSVELYVEADPPKSQPIGFAGPSAILGLSETVSGHVYSTSAVAVGNLTLSFVPRPQLLQFLRADCNQCMQVVQQLSQDLYLLYQMLREQGLPARSHKSYPRYIH